MYLYRMMTCSFNKCNLIWYNGKIEEFPSEKKIFDVFIFMHATVKLNAYKEE